MILLLFQVLCGTLVGYVLLSLLQKQFCKVTPELAFIDTEYNRNIVDSCQAFHNIYKFPVWALSGNLQSLYAAVVRRGSPQPFQREQIMNSETDHIVTIDWAHPETSHDGDGKEDSNDESLPIIVFVPGIAGSIDNQYTKRAVEALRREQWRVVVYNHPGCGGSEIQSPYVILQGDTRDVRAIIDHTRELYPSAPIIGVGISLGANLLCRYVGEEGHNCPLLGAVSLAQGFDGILTVEYLKRRPIYGLPLLAKFKSIIRKFSQVFETVDGVNLKKVFRSWSFHDFDAHFTMKIHRQYSRPDFYKLVSSSSFLDQIQVPTLLANATDDPLFQTEQHDIAVNAAQENENIVTCFTSKGGHASWVQCGGLFSPHPFSWGDTLMVQWCRGLLQNRNSRDFEPVSATTAS